MRKREVALYGCVGVFVALMLAYAPIVVAWMKRSDNPPLAHSGPPEPWRRFTGVDMNWFMRLLPGIYRPVLRVHAGLCGWDPLPHVMGIREEEFLTVIFEKRGTYEAARKVSRP